MTRSFATGRRKAEPADDDASLKGRGRTVIAACAAALCLALAPSLAMAEDVEKASGGVEPPAVTRGFAAYTVYTYNGGPQGMAGRIRDTGSAVTPIRNLATGLNGDPQVEGVVSGADKLRIAVTNRVAEPGAAPPTRIYDATPATNPAPLFTRTWPNVRNMSGLVKAGKYLYAIDYDNARVVEINRSSFQETGVTFTLPKKLQPSGFTPRGQALIEVGGTLFGLFNFPDSSFATYGKSLLVRFTIKGGVSIKVREGDYNANLVENSFAIAASGPDIYVASIGGSMTGGSYNKKSRLQSIAHGAADLGAARLKTVMKPSKDEPYEIRDVSFNGSRAYVLLGAYDANFTLQGKLVTTNDFSTFRTIDDFSSGGSGYFWAAQYTPENNRLWYGRGDQIRVYDASAPARPVLAETLTLEPGSLISSGDRFDNINDLAFVGATGSVTPIRGYRSPVQVSQTPRGRAAREIAQGRPELTAEETKRLDRALAGAN